MVEGGFGRWEGFWFADNGDFVDWENGIYKGMDVGEVDDFFRDFLCS